MVVASPDEDFVHSPAFGGSLYVDTQTRIPFWEVHSQGNASGRLIFPSGVKPFSPSTPKLIPLDESSRSYSGAASMDDTFVYQGVDPKYTEFVTMAIQGGTRGLEEYLLPHLPETL